MLLLAVDTAGITGSVALVRGEGGPLSAQVLATAEFPGRTFSARLIPAIAEVLGREDVTDRQDATLASLDALAVVRGPGSFTGLRVGLSAVKGLAEATGKPVIALSGLAVMASRRPDADAVHAVLDAGRGEFYHGLYRDSGGTCIAESLETIETLTSTLRQTRGTVLACEAAVIDALIEFQPEEVSPTVAADALPLALRAWNDRRFADVASLDANYLRRSDAELFSKAGREAAAAIQASARQ